MVINFDYNERILAQVAVNGQVEKGQQIYVKLSRKNVAHKIIVGII